VSRRRGGVNISFVVVPAAADLAATAALNQYLCFAVSIQNSSSGLILRRHLSAPMSAVVLLSLFVYLLSRKCFGSPGAMMLREIST